MPDHALFSIHVSAAANPALCFCIGLPWPCLASGHISIDVALGAVSSSAVIKSGSHPWAEGCLHGGDECGGTSRRRSEIISQDGEGVGSKRPKQPDPPQ